MSSALKTIYVNTDMLIRLTDLRNEDTGDLITGATVSADVFDSVGSQIGSTLNFTEVAGKDGSYVTTIPDSLAIAEADTGTIVITADGGAGLAGEWTLDWVGALRRK